MDEADHLQELLKACHRVLPKLAHQGDDHLAETIRQTCRTIEARLQELGVTSPSAQTS